LLVAAAIAIGSATAICEPAEVPGQIVVADIFTSV
jgi:hypothetical protein